MRRYDQIGGVCDSEGVMRKELSKKSEVEGQKGETTLEGIASSLAPILWDGRCSSTGLFRCRKMRLRRLHSPRRQVLRCTRWFTSSMRRGGAVPPCGGVTLEWDGE
jgi:hypothetical protein